MYFFMITNWRQAVYTPPQVSEFPGEENGEFAQRGSSLHWRKFCFYRSFTIYVAQWVFVNLYCWGLCFLMCEQFLYLATATAGKSLKQRGHQSAWGWWPQSSTRGSLCCQQVLISCTVSGILHRMDLFSSTCCLAIVVQPCSCLSTCLRLVSRLFYDCDQGQADPVVAIARDQSSVYLQLLMHETQPPSQLTVSTITRYVMRNVLKHLFIGIRTELKMDDCTRSHVK